MQKKLVRRVKEIVSLMLAMMLAFAGTDTKLFAEETFESAEEETVTDFKGYVDTIGTTYMQTGERKIAVRGWLPSGIKSSDISENYLVNSSGEKLALRTWQNSFEEYEYDDDDEVTSTKNGISTTFDLYEPLGVGTYSAYLRTTSGTPYLYASLIVTEQATAVEASIAFDYDNYGDDIYVFVRGVNFGTGENLSPVLKYNEQVVANGGTVSRTNYGGSIGVDCSIGDGYLFKMKKVGSSWASYMEPTLQFENTSVVNMISLPLWWGGEDSWDDPIQYAYYDASSSVTNIQFKSSLGIKSGTKAKFTLNSYADDETTIASGSGTIDKNGLLSLSLKTPSNGNFAPTTNNSYEDFWCYIDLGEEYNGRLTEWGYSIRIYRKPSSSSSYTYVPFSFVDNTNYIYTTDKSFLFTLIIDSSYLSGNAALTASLEGYTTTLKKSGSYYTGEIAFEKELTEGVKYLTVAQGSKSLTGVAPVYVLQPDTFYETSQSVYRSSITGTDLAVYLVLPNIIKKYYSASSKTEAESQSIWENEEMDLEVFSPTGEKIDATITSYALTYGSFSIGLKLPENAKDFYGYYIRVTSRGKTGVYLFERISYYQSYENNWRESGTHDISVSDELGLYATLGNGIFFPRQITDGTYALIYMDAESTVFPVTLTFSEPYNATPISTITISKSETIASNGYCYYYFTDSDISKLSKSLPYMIIACDSGVKSFEQIGYVGTSSSGTVKLAEVAINEKSPEVAVGGTVALTYAKTPASATVSNTTWKSSNTKVATVDGNGVVTGVKEGTATITLTADGKSATVQVSVVKKQVALTALSIEKAEMSLSPGDVEDIGIQKTPADTTDTITCTSSNPKVAAVDASGKVTAIGIGEALITVSSGEFSENCKVTVAANLTGLSLAESTLSLTTGQKMTISPTPIPSQAKIGTLSYESDASEIVSVDQAGNLTARKAGTATITVLASDAENEERTVTAKIKVVVTSSDLANTTSEEEITRIEEKLSEEETPVLWIDGLKESYEYAGASIEPAVTVYYDTERLHLGKEYKISYKNNKKVGTGTLTVTGKGNYGGSVTKNFTIVNAKTGDTSLKKATVDGLEKNYVYTGSPLTPNLTIKLGETTLIEGTDYLLAFSRNTDVGTATVTISGINTYKGSIKKSFKITAVDLNAAEKAGSLTTTITNSYYRSGGAAPQAAISYSVNGRTWSLREGVDYKLSYKNNKKAGNTASVAITGQGNFTKKLTLSTTVLPEELEELTMSVTDVKYNAKKKGSYYQSKVKIYDANGKALKEKRDYTLTYFDATKGAMIDKNMIVGEGDLIIVTATATANGSYEGALREEYTVAKAVKNISSSKPSKIANQSYTGDEIEPKITISGLTEGKDFEVAYYINNVKKGKATVLIRGIGDYSGTKTVTFKIVATNAKSIFKGAWNGTEFVKD